MDWVNLMLAGSFSDAVNAVIFGGRIVALAKKDGGVRPITVGYTLRHLAAKCANNHVIASRSQELQPQQLGAGVSGGAEAAVHATRRLAQNLPGSPTSCSSSYLWHYRGGMLSHFKTRSPPARSLQSVVSYV